MTLAIKIVLAIVIVAALAVSVLRMRKLRRDEQRQRFQRVDRRLLAPPPSPYTPSKGFRLLDSEVPLAARPEPPRPRLEPEHEYVFSEAQLPPIDESALAAARHDARWALSRSAHRSPFSGSGSRVGVILIVAILIIGSIGYYVQHHHSHAPKSATTTTTTVASSSTTTTTVAWPSSFTATATSASAKTASYSVPANKYRVTVSGAAGAVWTVYRMGPNNTLEYQGTVAQGQSYSLAMTGVSQITLGSPRNATVTVGGSSVNFPTPLSAPLTLIFTPSTSAAG